MRLCTFKSGEIWIRGTSLLAGRAAFLFLTLSANNLVETRVICQSALLKALADLRGIPGEEVTQGAVQSALQCSLKLYGKGNSATKIVREKGAYLFVHLYEHVRI